MKKTLIALTVAASTVATANAATVYEQDGTKLDVYGSVRVVLTKQTGQRFDLQNDGSRIGFQFSQGLTDDLSAIGQVEFRPGVTNGDTSTFGSDIITKYAYAGLKSNAVGKLTFGRSVTAGDGFKLADPTEQFVHVHNAVGLTTSSNKVISFSSANFLGFGLQGSYVFDDKSTKEMSNMPYRNANQWQAMLTYDNKITDNMSVTGHALYANQKEHLEGIPGVNSGDTQSKHVWGLAAAVKFYNVGLAVDYAQAKYKDNQIGAFVGYNDNGNLNSLVFANKAKAFQIAATYQLTDPMDIYAAYHHFRYTDPDITGDLSINGFSVGSHYKVNKNVLTYIEYDYDKANADNAKADHKGYVGLRVYF